MRSLRIAISTLILLYSAAAFAAETQLIAPRSTWKYLDNGTNPGTGWRAASYDDSTWKSGAAELGYGDGDEATIVGYGPDPYAKYVTTFFRQTFNVTNPSAFSGLTMRMVRDDGAVVYVNGTEVWRVNMPDGSISPSTYALGVVGGTDETAWLQKTLSPSLLVSGTNVVTVEVHQCEPSSSDLSFALELRATDSSVAASVTRGPYLQLGTPSTITIRWRTDVPTDSRVRYGTSLGALTSVVDDATQKTEHVVKLTGLAPGTRYYYSVGTASGALAGGDAAHSFLTAPSRGTSTPTRIWVLGDSGTADYNARMVANAYSQYATPSATNLWLMLGDNAYDNGTDPEFQAAVFDMYPEMLRASVLWPTLGNHDTAGSTASSTSYAYHKIFTLPTAGEAGGIASGTESYYSFDYGNIHFICLDSMTSDRSPTGPMMTWLKNDLAATSARWIIAFWHHPPYSKGSHDSDIEWPLVEMRKYAVPLLEEAGVDLVLSGHSHSYERSYLIDGHYGESSTFTASMKLDGGDGRPSGNGAYTKSGSEGAVYAVAGSSGMVTPARFGHPAMFISLTELGSMVLEINGDRLDAKFLREDGSLADTFTIRKGVTPKPPAPASNLTATATSSSSIALAWTDNSTDELGFIVQRCTGTACTEFVEIARTASNATSFANGGLDAATLYRYRIVAFNSVGTSTPSNEAEATTMAPSAPAAASNLTATATSSSSIALAWTDNSADESGFIVERCSGASCSSFAEVARAAANATSFTNSGLTASTLYRYRVIAFSSSGNAAPSNEAEATTSASAPTAPAAASNLTATATSSSSIALAWTDNSADESGFIVERCSGASCSTFAEVARTAANATSFTNSGLTASTLYRYRVIAFNSSGNAAPSNEAEATTAAPPPAAASNLTASATSSSAIALAWTDNSANESGFIIERCSGASCTSFAEVARTAANATSFTNSGLTASTLYRYRVIAFNSSGNAAPSNVAEATTQAQLTVPAAPENLVGSVQSGPRVNLTWSDRSTNEDGFVVERCTGNNCTNFAPVAQVGANVTSFANTSLSRNTSYRFRVRAFNAAGNSAYSNIISVRTSNR